MYSTKIKFEQYAISFKEKADVLEHHLSTMTFKNMPRKISLQFDIERMELEAKVLELREYQRYYERLSQI